MEEAESVVASQDELNAIVKLERRRAGVMVGARPLFEEISWALMEGYKVELNPDLLEYLRDPKRLEERGGSLNRTISVRNHGDPSPFTTEVPDGEEG